MRGRNVRARVVVAVVAVLAMAASPLACSGDNATPLTSTGTTTPDAARRDVTSGGDSHASDGADGSALGDGATTEDGATPDGGADGAIFEDVVDAGPPDVPPKETEPEGGKGLFDGGLARVRFVNAAPGSASFDVCMKLSSTSSYTGPLLAGTGAASGVAFPSISAYGTHTQGYYDFIFVPAPASDCSATPTAAITHVPLVDSHTLAFIEMLFPPSTVGKTAVALDDRGDPQVGSANVRFHSTQGAGVDFDGVQGQTTARWFTNVGGGESTTFFATPGGTYSLRISQTGTATLVVQVDGVTLTAADVLDTFLYTTFSPSQSSGLLRCPQSVTPTSPCVN